MVNDAWHECLQPDDAKQLVDDLRARGEAALTAVITSMKPDAERRTRSWSR